MPPSHAQQGTTSAWSPLRQPLFRVLWITAVASNIGTWMHDVGGVVDDLTDALPHHVIARRKMGLDAVGYGVLLGCLGAGAVAGAAILPQVRQRVVVDRLAMGATVVLAFVAVVLATMREERSYG